MYTPTINQTLYNKLYTYAYWIIIDEDFACKAVNYIIMTAPSITFNDEEHFKNWYTQIVYKRRKDYWRTLSAPQSIKSIHNNFNSQTTFDTEWIPNEPESEPNEKLEQLKQLIKPEELEWMLQYQEKKVKGICGNANTPAERLKFLRLKKKILTKLR